MKKKEFKVGEVFDLGLMKIRVDKMDDNKRCRECFFYHFCCDCEETRYAMIGACNGREREDGTDAVFKLVEE